MKVYEVIDFLESCFPLTLASDFDQGKIGLNVGSLNIEVRNVLFALDVTLDVVEEALNKDCNLIVTHHSFLFDPLTKIDYDTNKAKILRKVFAHSICLYSMHTNLDVGEHGVNDTLASLLKLESVKIDAAKNQFLRYGNLSSQTLDGLIEHVKDKFELSGVRYVGPLNKEICRVGIVGGSGATIEEIDRCVQLGLDCFITGEIKLHIAQYASSLGLALIEVNHGVEKYGLVPIQKALRNRFAGKFGVFLSTVETDPLKNK